MRPRATGPTAIFRMYMSGSDGIEPRGDAAIIETAFVPPRATTARPSSGSSARSYSSPPAPIDEPGRQLLGLLVPADHDLAADRHLLERDARPRERRLLGGLLVGAAEPAGAGRAPNARSRAQTISQRHCLRPSPSVTRGPGAVRPTASTISITSSTVRSTFAFSTTGTLSRRARPTT